MWRCFSKVWQQFWNCQGSFRHSSYCVSHMCDHNSSSVKHCIEKRHLFIGKFVLAASEKKGLGGAMKFIFRCNGCWKEEISYKSSQLARDSRRHLVSLALSLAFFVGGHGYGGYCRTLGGSLRLGIVSDKPFLEIIDLAFPNIKEMLDDDTGCHNLWWLLAY